MTRRERIARLSPWERIDDSKASGFFSQHTYFSCVDVRGV